MRIELSCAKCGDNSIKIIEGMDNDAVVRCVDCDHVIGTVADLKERVARDVARHAEGSD